MTNILNKREAEMVCAKKTNYWNVFDARTKKIHYMGNKEFKNLLLDTPHKLVCRKIYVDQKQVWIDCILNSEFFR